MQVTPGAAALVGRDHELATLVAAALSGPGGVTLVTGEAGSGKTRLLEEVARRAAVAGTRVLRGHAVPGGGPFRPLAQALAGAAEATLAEDPRLAPYRGVLARILPAWTLGPADAASAPHLVDPVLVLGEAVAELLGVLAAERRVVVVLDDLHWADRDSLAVLEYVSGRLTGTGAQVLGSVRSDERQPEGLAPLRRGRQVDVVELRRLDPSDAGALVAGVLGGDVADEVREHVAAAADGLPLLVEELAARLADSGAISRRDGRWHASGPLPTEVPEAFADAVTGRVAGLGPGDREIVHVAALLGRDLPWDLLPIAAGVDAAAAAGALRRAVDARLLVAGADGGLRWRHALTQDAVLAALTGPERALLAAQAARTLDRPDLAGPLLARVAELHARGGDPDRAAALLLRHAREHRAAGAPAAALAVLEQATALAGDAHRVPVAVERVEVLALAARTDEALAIGRPLLSAGNPALAVALARACAAAERFDEARELLERAGDPDAPGVLALAAHVALGSGSTTEAVDLAERALAGAEGEAACEALEVVGRAQRRADPEASAAAFGRAAAIAEHHGLVAWRIRALAELGVADLFGLGDGAALRRARELAAEAGMLGTALMLDLQLVALENGRKGPIAAAAAGERCAEQAGRLGLHGLRGHALQFVARGRVFADRAAESDALLTEATELSAHPVHVESARALARAHDLWLGGTTAEAVAWHDAAIDVLRRAEGANPTPSWGERAVLRTALVPDDPAPREELRGSDVLVQALNRGALHYCDAVTTAERGDDPAPDLAAGDGVLRHRPFFRHLLRCYLLEHSVLGDPVPVLHEALVWSTGAGEVRLTRWCRERLRTLGAPVPRPQRDTTGVPPDLRAVGVTGREMEVLRLVGDGLANPEIAARLHLSRRTVESHVGNLLAKTGAVSRGELRGRLTG